MCYPALLQPQSPPEYLRERTLSPDAWYLRNAPDGWHLIRDVSVHDHRDLGPVVSIRHAERAARAATQRRNLRFDPHPWLSAVLPLWGVTAAVSKRLLRQQAVAASARRADAEVSARRTSAACISPEIGGALDQVDWADIHSLPHSSSHQRLLFYRFKGLRLSGWDQRLQRHGCPHCPNVGASGGSSFHIMWDCPYAQRLWKRVRSWWSAFGYWRTRDSATARSFVTAAFSLQLPRTPPRSRNLSSLSRRSSPTDGAPEGSFPALQAAWQQIVLETMVVISSCRNRSADDTLAWSLGAATGVHVVSCQRVLATLAHRFSTDARSPACYAPLVRELCNALEDSSSTSDGITPPPSETRDPSFSCPPSQDTVAMRYDTNAPLDRSTSMAA